MQLKQLAHFLAAIDQGSISAAAESPHVTQPARTDVTEQQKRRILADNPARLFGIASGAAAGREGARAGAECPPCVTIGA